MSVRASLALADLVALHHRIEEVFAGGASGVVVTQGTDTLEETANFLDLVSHGSKPIVVTGAIRPPGAGADAPANLFAAIQVAASLEAWEGGVLVVFDDQVHSAARVRNARTAGPGAFASPDTGPLGWVVEGELRMLARRNDRLLPPSPDADVLLRSSVALITVSLGEDARLLNALPGLGYDGIVVEAMGAGHVPRWLVEPVTRLAGLLPWYSPREPGPGASTGAPTASPARRSISSAAE